jgi:thiamine-monophosphate kinase
MPLSERRLIAEIRGAVRGGDAVVTGIGDDCAVLRIPKGHEVLVTTDFSIENVHFRRDWHPADLVGWRCLARGLSDIAAMGGEPRAAFLSLAVAGDIPQPWIRRFMTGLLDLAGRFKVPLAGGDTAQSASGIQADIVVIGSVPRGKSILRSGAKVGDLIYVTGSLGGSAAALDEVARLNPGSSRGMRTELLRQMRPLPRLLAGQWLRQHKIASAMIDISDGLSTDLSHICEESLVGADIEATAIPRTRILPGKEPEALDYALHGGDDYELLFTSSKQVASNISGLNVTSIGRITRTAGLRIISDGKARRLPVYGWEHFKKRK